MRWVVVALVAACGRADFDALPDGSAAFVCPPTTMPAASSFSDDFSSGSLPPNWTDGSSCVVETGGELVAPVPPNMAQQYCTAITIAAYHLTCDAITMHVPEVTTPVIGVQTVIYLFGQSDALWLLLDNGGFALTDANGMQNDSPPGPYDPINDAWWRLREYAGTTHFEVSPDGITWSPRAHIPDPFPLDNLRIALGAGAYDAIPNPGQARFHCYNVPPPCN